MRPSWVAGERREDESSRIHGKCFRSKLNQEVLQAVTYVYKNMLGLKGSFKPYFPPRVRREFVPIHIGPIVANVAARLLKFKSLCSLLCLGAGHPSG